MTTETNNARPTHRIFAVTKGDKKKFWQPIGALWTNSNGFNQRFDYARWWHGRYGPLIPPST
jgi:hypothetical protein